MYCGICGLVIRAFDDLVPDHIEPGKIGGCKDNSDKNLQPAHAKCNLLKGSKRNYSREACLKDLGICLTRNAPNL